MRLLFWLCGVRRLRLHRVSAAAGRLGTAVRPRESCAGRPASRTEPPGVSIVIAARNEGRACRPASTTCSRSTTRPTGGRSSSCRTDRPTTRSAVLQRAERHGSRRWPYRRRESGARSTPGVARARVTSWSSPTRGRRSRRMRSLALVAPFSDPDVGAVTGELILEGEAANVAGRRTANGAGGETDRRSLGAGRDAARVSTAGAVRRRPSPTASACTGGTRNRSVGSKVPSARRSARRARSTRCAARSGARCPRTRSSTTCWRRCGRAGGLPRRVRRSGARLRSRRARCARRAPPEDPDARRQLPDPLARAAAAASRRQSGVAAVRLAQGRHGSSCRTRCSLSGRERRAREQAALSTRLTLAVQCALYLLAGYGAWLDRQRVRTGPAESAAGSPSIDSRASRSRSLS